MNQQSMKGIHLLSEVLVSEDSVIGRCSNEHLFRIPCKKISDVQSLTNDIIFEINGEKAKDGDDELVEMRLFYHVNNDDTFSTEQICENFKKELNLEDSTGNVICILPDLPLVVPRGKYSADFYKNTFRLHGSSYNYNSKYSNISKTFLLPMADKSNACFIIGFDKPLKQGQTVYNFVAIQFKMDSTIEIDLSGKEDVLKTIDPSLELNISGPYYEVFTKIFKSFSKVNIIIPGIFKSTKGDGSVECAIGAKQGHLFLLNKSIIFILKPIIHFKHDEIAETIFHRMINSMSIRGFDLEIILRDGSSHTFSGIDKAESDGIQRYFTSGGVKFSIAAVDEGVNNKDDYEEEDSEEEDIQDEESGESEDDDFVAKEKLALDESDSDDEDFDVEEFKSKLKKKKK